MPFNERPDAQPDGNVKGDTHREYRPATWKPAGHGGGSPKIDGGFEVDQHGNPIATRGLNRPNQRYQQAPTVVGSLRQTRAIAEASATVCLRGVGNEYEVRGQSGNAYDVNLVNISCDCPDFRKLTQSYRGLLIFCKHIRIVRIQLNAAFPNDLPLSVQYVANQMDVDIRTVQDLCANAAINAVKRNGVWVIDPTLSAAQIAAYIARIPFYGGPANG